MISIGEAARRSGSSVATIRYYEEIGLIPKLRRNPAGRRTFTRTDVERLRFIRRLRAMAFGLNAVRQLIASTDGRGSCLDVRDVAKVHLDVLRARKAEIDALERALAELAGDCSRLCTDGPSPECTLVRDLQAAA